MSKQKLTGLTALVVGFNEAAYLEDCLTALSFCEHIVYLDLGSTDNSLQIASAIENVEVRSINRVPVVEIIHAQLEKYVKTDWVLLIDPDEHMNPELVTQVVELFPKLSSNSDVGVIEVPLFFYFKRNKLKGTVWGGLRYRNILIRRSATTFSPEVHVGKKLRPEFKIARIDFEKSNFIRHYWADSFWKLVGKHRRYLKQEGQVHLQRGESTSLNEVVRIFPNEFIACFIRNKGTSDGFSGFLLSLLWAWYQTSVKYELLKAQQKIS